MRSIIDNPTCWGAWEEPGAPDAPTTAAGEAASCDLAGTASSGAAMITFRRRPLAARNIDEAIAEVGRLEITRSDALGDYGFIREARTASLDMDAPATAAACAATLNKGWQALIRKEFDKVRNGLTQDNAITPIPFHPSAADAAISVANQAMRGLLGAVSGAALGEAWDRVVRDHIKYGTGVAAMGVVDDGIYDATTWTGAAMLRSADASLASPAFCGTAHVTLGAPYSAVRLEHGVGRQMVACDLPANTPRREVVQLLREFADVIEAAGGEQ